VSCERWAYHLTPCCCVSRHVAVLVNPGSVGPARARPRPLQKSDCSALPRIFNTGSSSEGTERCGLVRRRACRGALRYGRWTDEARIASFVSHRWPRRLRGCVRARGLCASSTWERRDGNGLAPFAVCGCHIVLVSILMMRNVSVRCDRRRPGVEEDGTGLTASWLAAACSSPRRGSACTLRRCHSRRCLSSHRDQNHAIAAARPIDGGRIPLNTSMRATEAGAIPPRMTLDGTLKAAGMPSMTMSGSPPLLADVPPRMRMEKSPFASRVHGHAGQRPRVVARCGQHRTDPCVDDVGADRACLISARLHLVAHGNATRVGRALASPGRGSGRRRAVRTRSGQRTARTSEQAFQGIVACRVMIASSAGIDDSVSRDRQSMAVLVGRNGQEIFSTLSTIGCLS